MNILIYILLPVHNRRNITQRFIECLAQQSFPDYHLVLIDDGSTDGTEQMVRERIENLTVIKGNGNWWWAGSLQNGINWLKGQKINADSIVLMINDDVVFGVDFLKNAIAAISAKKNTLILAQINDEKTGASRESGVFADLKRQRFLIAENPDKINCFSTRGLFLRFADVLRIGSFHPLLLPHYGSDYEFTIRAHRKGYKLETTPEAALAIDREQTGYHGIEANTFGEGIKRVFSKKSSQNPVYRTFFIIFTAPLFYMPRLIILAWINAFRLILRNLL